MIVGRPRNGQSIALRLLARCLYWRGFFRTLNGCCLGFVVVWFDQFRNLLPFWDELDGDTVDAVACVLGRELLTEKNVAKVTIAILANDFNSTAAVPVGLAFYGTLDLFLKRWPTAVTFELSGGVVERCVASFADVGANYLGIGVSLVSGFGALSDDNVGFVFGQLVEWIAHFFRLAKGCGLL